jgi:hypothetical protein
MSGIADRQIADPSNGGRLIPSYFVGYEKVVLKVTGEEVAMVDWWWQSW